MAVYHLVHDHVSRDTAEAMATINEGAAAGDIIGTALVVILRGRKFFVNITGEAHRDPHLTRGLIRCLDDELRSLTVSERPKATLSWPRDPPPEER